MKMIGFLARLREACYSWVTRACLKIFNSNFSSLLQPLEDVVL